jgi:hypothetical protein
MTIDTIITHPTRAATSPSAAWLPWPFRLCPARGMRRCSACCSSWRRANGGMPRVCVARKRPSCACWCTMPGSRSRSTGNACAPSATIRPGARRWRHWTHCRRCTARTFSAPARHSGRACCRRATGAPVPSSPRAPPASRCNYSVPSSPASCGICSIFESTFGRAATSRAASRPSVGSRRALPCRPREPPSRVGVDCWSRSIAPALPRFSTARAMSRRSIAGCCAGIRTTSCPIPPTWSHWRSTRWTGGCRCLPSRRSGPSEKW